MTEPTMECNGRPKNQKTGGSGHLATRPAKGRNRRQYEDTGTIEGKSSDACAGPDAYGEQGTPTASEFIRYLSHQSNSLNQDRFWHNPSCVP